jgi:hypothetical protein
MTILHDVIGCPQKHDAFDICVDRMPANNDTFAYSSVCLTAVESMRICAFEKKQLTDKVCIFQAVLDRSGIYAHLCF